MWNCKMFWMKFKILKNVSLKNYSTFRIGGNAKELFFAKNTKNLLNFCKFCIKNNKKFKIIGFGANLLFNDDGYDGTIIVNKSSLIKFKNNHVFADSGVAVSNLINKCYLRSLGGLENLSGIPSTVGGAIVNSLGAFQTNFFDYIDYVECVDIKKCNRILKLKKQDCNFGYRTSIFKNGQYIILKTKLKLNLDSPENIKSKIVQAIATKTKNQPLNYPSAGSIFKRNGDVIPAKIIDELNLKGTRIGDAQISTKHAGFIINLGNASSKDCKALIALIENKVYSSKNIHLEKEIEFVD